jgi:hypothetical protein
VTTFTVSAVERSAEVLATIDTRGAIAALLDQPIEIEACSPGSFVVDPARGKWRWHPFVAAADCAFNRHLPLVLSPDQIWLCIAQGITAAKRLEARATGPSRELLEIRRDDWMRGDPNNPWPSIFDDFAARIGAQHPDLYDLVQASFSTTGATERAAFAVTLMDAMQDYYAYRGSSLCGIPEVTLLGTADDYREIAARVAKLADHGLGWWVTPLDEVCARLVDAAAGTPDVEFFRSFYKRDESSGGPHMNGWINCLFPYEWNHVSKAFDQRNEYAERWHWPTLDVEHEDMDLYWQGAKQKALPLGLSRAPLSWRVLVPPAEYRYELLAGFVGVSQDPTSLALRAEIGWAVRAGS